MQRHTVPGAQVGYVPELRAAQPRQCGCSVGLRQCGYQGLHFSAGNALLASTPIKWLLHRIQSAVCNHPRYGSPSYPQYAGCSQDCKVFLHVAPSTNIIAYIGYTVRNEYESPKSLTGAGKSATMHTI